MFQISGLPWRSYILGLTGVATFGLLALLGWSIHSTTQVKAQTPPGPVSNIVLNGSRTAGNLPVSWTAGSNATSYHVTYSSNGGSSWSLFALNHSGTSATITGVTDSASYIVGVRSMNDNGSSSWVNSATIGPLVDLNSQSAPGPVSNIVLNGSRTAGNLPVSWTAGSNATSYHITYSSNGGSSWSLFAIDHSGTSATITGVTDSASYIVGVRSKNSSGGSGWVNSAVIAPLNSLNSSPPNTPGDPFLQKVGRGNGTLPIAWDFKNTGNLVYDIVYSSDNKVSWSSGATNVTGTICTSGQVHVTPEISRCYTLQGLDNTKDYWVAVRAKWANEHSSVSNWINSRSAIVDVPEPRYGSVRQLGCTTSAPYVLSISWDTNLSDTTGLSTIVKYKVASNAEVTHNDTTAPVYSRIQKSGVWGSYLQLADNVLPKETNAYTVTVKLQNSKTVGGQTLTSNEVSHQITAGTDSQTSLSLKACPSAPTNLVYDSAARKLTWTGPDSTYRFYDALEYDVRYKVQGSNDWVVIPATLDDYISDTNYTFASNLGTLTDVSVRSRNGLSVWMSHWTDLTIP